MIQSQPRSINFELVLNSEFKCPDLKRGYSDVVDNFNVDGRIFMLETFLECCR